MDKTLGGVGVGMLAAILALQVYGMFLRGEDPDQVIRDNQAIYEAAVFDATDNKGVMHQVFRQNEVDRELLKVLLERCSR